MSRTCESGRASDWTDEGRESPQRPGHERVDGRGPLPLWKQRVDVTKDGGFGVFHMGKYKI